jgi:hypothetical protein
MLQIQESWRRLQSKLADRRMLAHVRALDHRGVQEDCLAAEPMERALSNMSRNAQSTQWQRFILLMWWMGSLKQNVHQ